MSTLKVPCYTDCLCIGEAVIDAKNKVTRRDSPVIVPRLGMCRVGQYYTLDIWQVKACGAAFDFSNAKARPVTRKVDEQEDTKGGNPKQLLLDEWAGEFESTMLGEKPLTPTKEEDVEGNRADKNVNDPPKPDVPADPKVVRKAALEQLTNEKLSELLDEKKLETKGNKSEKIDRLLSVEFPA